ncbi:hypothetical protein [Nocardioides humi]|uniref:Lipoprotein n=1 Tax=Nocardioides humi TaxID=449461 RepID=A0ABN1ZUV1_9ACTN|nr:hypothetical protein [Nocardioides humi]
MRRLGVALVVLLALPACGGPGDAEIREHAERGADRARPLADAFAAEFDASPETVADEIVHCRGKAPDDASEELDYVLHLDFDDADEAHLAEVAAAYEADGWRTRVSDFGVRFLLREDIVLSLSREGDRAVVTGSAGCWPE